MIKEFKSIEELNNYYYQLFADVNDVGLVLDENIEKKIREQLVNSYELDCKLLSYNDSFEIKLRERELKAERLRSKMEYKIRLKQLREDLAIDRKAKMKELKANVKSRRQLIAPKKEKHHFSLKDVLSRLRKSKKPVKD